MIFLAGPAVNLVVSFVLLSVVTAALGIPDNTRLEAFGIIQGTPADIAGIRAGDTITAALMEYPSNPTRRFTRLSRTILAKRSRSPSPAITASKRSSPSRLPRVSPPDGQGPIGLGVRSAKKSASFLEIITGTAQAFGDYVKSLFEIIGRLVTGTAGPNDQLVGFRGMFDVYSYTQSQDVTASIPGWVTALNFFGLISASLGIVNLLPIPALDGGRIFLSLPELMFRVKIPRKVETAITIAGFILLMLLMLYINVKDFIKPIPLPGS